MWLAGADGAATAVVVYVGDGGVFFSRKGLVPRALDESIRLENEDTLLDHDSQLRWVGGCVLCVLKCLSAVGL